MTPEQMSTFRDSGYLLLQQALARKQVEPVRTQVLDELKRRRIWSSGRSLSSPIPHAPAFQQIAKLSEAFSIGGPKRYSLLKIFARILKIL